MGIFDFFNNKKKEKARQEQLRLQEEKRRAEEQRRLAERRKQEEQQRREESFLSNFEFDSTCHQRYENGQLVRGLQAHAITWELPCQFLLILCFSFSGFALTRVA